MRRAASGPRPWAACAPASAPLLGREGGAASATDSSPPPPPPGSPPRPVSPSQRTHCSSSKGPNTTPVLPHRVCFPLSDNPPNPSSTRGQADSQMLTNWAKQAQPRSQQAHGKERRPAAGGEPAPRSPPGQQREASAVVPSPGSGVAPAAHSVPGLRFLYLESNRAGPGAAQGPLQS